MADVKQGWTAARGLLLAAATGFPALAHAAPPRAVVELAPQRIPPPLRSRGAPRPKAAPAGRSMPGMSPPTESIPIESLPIESLRVEPPPARSMPVEPDRPKAAPIVSPPVQSLPIEPDCRAAECKHKRSRPIAQWWERHKAHCRDKLWGYPEEFVPAQLGAAVADNVSRQVARAQEARMVVYQYDFLPMSYELKPRARMALAKYGGWASHGAGPIFIEPTPGHPDLDEARRLAVWREMQCGPFAIPPEMIAIGCSEILGLRGGEALLVDKNLMMQTSSRGTAMGGGGGGLLGGGGLGGSMGGMSGGMSGGSTSSGSTGSTGMGY
jgi:hypothetical protein